MQDAATLHLTSAAQIYSAAGPARIRNMRILILLLILLSLNHGLHPQYLITVHSWGEGK